MKIFKKHLGYSFFTLLNECRGLREENIKLTEENLELISREDEFSRIKFERTQLALTKTTKERDELEKELHGLQSRIEVFKTKMIEKPYVISKTSVLIELNQILNPHSNE